MTAVFTYGSLMFDALWSRLVRGEYRQSAAILPGYRLHAIRHETFPAIIQTSDIDQVSGIVYLDVALNDLARLDAFEGDYYRRETLSVIAAGKTISAATYILRDEFMPLLDEHDWNAAEFEQRHLARIIADYL